jgi:hypothetical protein
MTDRTGKLKLYKPWRGSGIWGGEVNGNFDTLDPALVAAPVQPDAKDVASRQVKVYINEGANKLKFYAKYGDGTYNVGELSLTTVTSGSWTPPGGNVTPKLELTKPAQGDLNWADPVNVNWETLDAAVVAADPQPGAKDVEKGQIKAYIDEYEDELKFFVKYSDGAYKVGDIALSPSPTPTPTPTPTASGPTPTPTPTVSGPTPTPDATFQDPDGDVSTEWDATSTPHYAILAQGVRSPDAPETDEYIYISEYATGSDQFSLTDALNGSTSVKIWAYGTTDLGPLRANLYIGGAWQTEAIIIPVENYTPAWHSVEFTGSWTAQQLSAAQIRFRKSGTGTATSLVVYAAYVEYG